MQERLRVVVAICFVLSGVTSPTLRAESGRTKLWEARKGYKTRLVRQVRDAEPLEAPNAEFFSLVKYETAIGEMSAYLSKPQEGQKKLPAIIWLTGGLPPGGIGAAAWEEQPPGNDQSAKAYRLAGMVMMYPTLRGSAGNPGFQECFYGEVDDVLAALAFLKTVEYVDPDLVYLGGHSTGATLALLVAASTNDFRGVFAFGPAEDPSGYGAENLTYDSHNKKENNLRSPIRFLSEIVSPTFVIEGDAEGNYGSLIEMERKNGGRNDKLQFMAIQGANHFNILAPLNKLFAEKIVMAKGADIAVTRTEAQESFGRFKTAIREAADLAAIDRLKAAGVDVTAAHTTVHVLLAREQEALSAARRDVRWSGFEVGQITKDRRYGREFFVLFLRKRVRLDDFSAVHAMSKIMADLEAKHGVLYAGWGID